MMLDKFQRPLLLAGIFISGYLLLLQWQADYGEREITENIVQDLSSGGNINPNNPANQPAPTQPSSPANTEANPQTSTQTSTVNQATQPSPNQNQDSNNEFIAPSPDLVDESAAIINGGTDRQSLDGNIDAGNIDNLAELNLISIENDKLRIFVDLRGGDIVLAALKDYREVRTQNNLLLLLREDRQRLAIAQTGLIGRNGPDASANGRPLYNAEQTQYLMADGAQSIRVPLSFEQDGVLITKTFVLHRDRHDIDIEWDINNRGTQTWQANMFAQFKRDGERPTYEKATFGARSFTGAAFSTASDNYRKLDFGDIENRNFQENTKAGWVAMVQHYFVAAFVPEKVGNDYSYSARQTADGDYIFGFVGPAFAVASNRQYQDNINLYLGPKIREPLDALAPDLSLTIDYGWLWYISQPLYSFLDFLHSYAQNWGLAIILMTIIIKLIFFPLTNASYKSMGRMRKLQPQMEQIRKNHADNRQQMQKEIMDLYKREKVNPLGGCLPILVQMPIFIAFYWTLIESVELRHAPLVWWIQDLSALDPFYVLPLLMGASMWVQQLFSPMPTDPTQARIMKLLPVIFTVFFLWFPSGLVLYWLVNNILTVMQQYIINRRLGTAIALSEVFSFKKNKPSS